MFGSSLIRIERRNFSLSWVTRTDSLPCDLPVGIFKLSECKQVDLSAGFLDDYANFLVSMNDTVQLDFKLNFILIVTKS